MASTKPASTSEPNTLPPSLAPTIDAVSRGDAPAASELPSSPDAVASTDETPVDAAAEKAPPAPSSRTRPTIDMEQFNQILELDADDPEYDFSASMVGAYFGQAISTFVEMEEALATKNLAKLSELGHFLKGSSAQLGVSHVQASCAKIQHYGQLKDLERHVDLTDSEALDMISSLMSTVKLEYDTAEAWLKDYFKQKGVEVVVEEVA
ncbi:histidine-phosphotransfer domain, HPT domain-containing protein [Hymenopellis radicata]|nr:histidine-phosphotransfer domain, HPT domain-containing protein [Hymenopellis radicata]